MQQRLGQRLEQQHQGIDMSPLLDVVFILLIFFIVTTVYCTYSERLAAASASPTP